MIRRDSAVSCLVYFRRIFAWAVGTGQIKPPLPLKERPVPFVGPAFLFLLAKKDWELHWPGISGNIRMAMLLIITPN